MSTRRQFLEAATGAGTSLAIARQLATDAAAAQETATSSASSTDQLNEHTDFVMSTSADPYVLFAQWYQEAKDAGETNVNVMVLATVDGTGMPDARIMLHQEIQNGSFMFTSFSNSAKGKQLKADPNAALVFYWAKLGRQVRVRGVAREFTKVEADTRYDAKRRSRILRLRDQAWHQSEIYSAAEELEQKLAEANRRYPGEVPRSDWTGWLISPVAIEFFYPHQKTVLNERLRFSGNSKDAGNRTACAVKTCVR
jgi:pyridoxamine 5'-phosphate oxidase